MPVMGRGNSRKPALCFQQFVEKTLEWIMELNRRYTLGQPLTDIKVMCSSDPSEADGCVPPGGVHKNDLLGLEVGKRRPVGQTVVRALVDAAACCHCQV
jgi:hypothetical protein